MLDGKSGNVGMRKQQAYAAEGQPSPAAPGTTLVTW
jgi:hypothetical protein